MPRVRRFNNEHQQKMVELAKSGYSGPEIASQIGCTTPTVYYHLNKYADKNNIPRWQLRSQVHKSHVFTDPEHKTWPVGSHQQCCTSSKEEVPEANVEEDIVVTTFESQTKEITKVSAGDTDETSPKEETLEASIEDVVVEEEPKDNAPKEINDELTNRINNIIAKCAMLIQKLQGGY